MDYIYTVAAKMDAMPKPAYTETKQTTVGKVRFKVTLGVMPDYSFNDGGLRIDGVTDGRPAAKAGLKGGDIIIQMGEHEIRGIQTYMEALGAFTEGEKTTITILREGKKMTMPLEFTPKEK
ncbi:MAG: PDZ domain-containing protein [Taibaiella sp.]|nr:PDZ domain-containing protein [Taibaiella sp.]